MEKILVLLLFPVVMVVVVVVFWWWERQKSFFGVKRGKFIRSKIALHNNSKDHMSGKGVSYVYR